MHIRHFAIVLGVTASAFTMYACGAKKPPPPEAPVVDTDAGVEDAAPPAPPPKKSLYDRLGGKDAIKAVVDSFVKKVTADKKVSGLMKNVTAKKMDAFKESLVNQICRDASGDCPDANQPLVDAYKGIKITDEQFDMLAADFKTTLVDVKVPDEEQADLTALFEDKRSILVNVKKPAPKK